MTDETTVSVTHACEIVSVSRRTLYNWIQAGKVRTKRTIGGGVRVFEADLWAPEGVDPSKRRPLMNLHESARAAGPR